MGQITSGIGLVTGFPITDTVDKLMAIQARPRDALQKQVDTLTTKQNAYTAISAAVVKLQLTAFKLGNPNTFDQRQASSSDISLLNVTTSGLPAVGSYQFTPIQKATSQQLLSTGFANSTDPIGAGQISLRFGGAIDQGVSLNALNGGVGVQAGSIKITDRGGASAIVDLRAARTVDDVIAAVNSNTNINVQLKAQGDRFVLTDRTGLTTANLRVDDVGGGTTAAGLGLAGINVASNQAQGQDIVSLGRDTLLSSLNNGNGIRFDSSLPDLHVTLHDGGSPLDLEFSTTGVTGTYATGTTDAAGGLNSQLVFTAVKPGVAYEGVQITFQHDSTIAKGKETAVYNATAKTLTFKINDGLTTTSDVVQALGRNATANAAFNVALPAGGSGAGLVSSSDSAVTGGPASSAITPGAAGVNSKLAFVALNQGANYDGVQIRFQDDNTITAGAETVAYDDSDPENKTLTFKIAAGQTTANQIIAALNRDAVVNQLFKAQTATGSNGTGIVSAADNVTTTGGTVVNPVPSQTANTIGALLDTINAADPARLKARISADGQRLELLDLTSGGGTFAVSSANGSKAAADLGLTGAESAGVISGRQLLAGLNTSLLSSLNGGSGLETLGLLQLTDRSGASASVNLAGSVTVQDLLDRINAAGIGITAAVNNARNGIALTDTTGASVSNLIVANGDGTTTAAKLGLATNAAATNANSGNLKLQVVGENTLLSSLNGGAGVAHGTFQIFGTATANGTIDLSNGDLKTVGELVTAINQLQIGVDARINSAGDGIDLVDTIGGSGTLRVEEGNSTTAADLRLLGASTLQTVDSQQRQVVSGSTTFSITINASDSLTDLTQKINALGGGLSAAQFNSGGGANPFRLTLNSQRSGQAGNLIFDTSQAGFSLQETAHGQDAILLFGSGSGSISTSNTNNFDNILPGVNLQLLGASNAPVTVTVASSSSSAATAIQALVDAYNGVVTMIAAATKFTPAAEGAADQTPTTGPLFGDATLLSVETSLSKVFSNRVLNAGTIGALATTGVSIQQDGTLTFDATAFDTAATSNSQGVKDFFTTTDTGFVDRLKTVTNRLASSNNAVLINRLDAISTNIKNDNDKIAQWKTRLDAEKNTLLLRFYNMDILIGKMQTNLKIIAGLQDLFSISSSSGSTSSSSTS